MASRTSGSAWRFGRRSGRLVREPVRATSGGDEPPDGPRKGRHVREPARAATGDYGPPVAIVPSPQNDQTLEDLEIQLLLEGVYRHYGFDFRNYAMASLRRRIRDRVRAEKVASITALLARVLHDQACLQRFLLALSVHISSFFRDPGFFEALRKSVIPMLSEQPFLRIWHAGCSSGEEVYSLAIVLQEEGIYDRCRIYATDMERNVLEQARSGRYPLSRMKDFTRNYMRSGGKACFSDYYAARTEDAVFDPALKKNVVFAEHNLATDRSFNEFNVILCRNVMIYFNDVLQERVHRLVHESMAMGGVLALGMKESLRFTQIEDCYELLDPEQRIYRRVR